MAAKTAGGQQRMDVPLEGDARPRRGGPRREAGQGERDETDREAGSGEHGGGSAGRRVCWHDTARRRRGESGKRQEPALATRPAARYKEHCASTLRGTVSCAESS